MPEVTNRVYYVPSTGYTTERQELGIGVVRIGNSATHEHIDLHFHLNISITYTLPFEESDSCLLILFFSFFHRCSVVSTQQIPSNNYASDTVLFRESTLLF